MSSLCQVNLRYSSNSGSFSIFLSTGSSFKVVHKRVKMREIVPTSLNAFDVEEGPWMKLMTTYVIRRTHEVTNASNSNACSRNTPSKM